MKKYIVSAFVVVIAISIILIFMSYKSSYSALYADKILTQDEEIQNAFKEYKIINCEFDLIKPEHAFVSFQHYVYPEDNSEMKFWRVDFYSLNRPHIFSKNWSIQRSGGTTVENTTFDELVTLAKEDCEQFKQPKGDFRDETINWIYSPYEPEPEKTEEQIEAEKQQSIADGAWEIRHILTEMLSEETVKKAIEEHGDWEGLSDEELIEWYKEASK